MRMGAARSGRIMLASLLLVSFCGCAAPEAKQAPADESLQASGDEQVIVVPVFILSPSQDGPVGNGVDPSGPASSEPATHGRGTLPARM